MSNQKLRVNGLANIGQFMARVPASTAPTAPPKKSAEAIIAKTMNAIPLGATGCKPEIERIFTAAIREALNLGHALALAQNDMVEALLNKQYDARTALTLPAAVAAIMEQTGMSELTLDLSAVATVFDRCKLDMAANAVDEHGDIIEYKLRHTADDEGASDNSYALAP